MRNLLGDEREFQNEFIDYLVSENGYIERKASNFNREFALDEDILFDFLEATQKEELEMLERTYNSDLKQTITNVLNRETTKKGGSLLTVLKDGITINNTHLRLMYRQPATSYNQELNDNYKKNIFSVMQEVYSADGERVDVVIFLNGLAIMTFELKYTYSGQTYEDAIEQYRTSRDPKSRLFLFKVGALVHFAMDDEEVHMTTKLAREDTFFLPFNKGRGEGVDSGAGNPDNPNGYNTSYMWEEILKKDLVIELITKFIFIETKEKVNEETGKVTQSEKVIFPRFHQLRAVKRVLDDVYDNGCSQNYLIQHSAGSGKTNSIAWLAHRFSEFHNAKDEVIFNSIIVMTDRVVVDKQLQRAIMGIEHKAGLVRVMSDDCTSSDLASALNSNDKIIVTTIHKFSYILDEVKKLKDKNFAVIIDEAHSSTSGKLMLETRKVLGKEDPDEEKDLQDKIVEDVMSHGKQDNLSIIAFTATPKPTTLQLFGMDSPQGQKQAFDLYSMKQAIEEGFILDVLQNYITYTTFYRLNKAIEDDPELETKEAKRQIAQYIKLHDTNISQRVQIIVEHFRSSVMHELAGKAKAMVVVGARAEAVKYKQAFDKYIEDRGYSDLRTIVAFSGTVQLSEEDGDKEHSEYSLNQFPSKRIPNEFDSDNYQLLIVAKKFQTGFDQPKLCAMYIMKKLRGVNAVQTISRLNRICPPYEKKTFVLDFVNDYSDIEEAFEPFYTGTFLANSVTPQAIYELSMTIDGYYIIDQSDIDKANDIIYKEKHTSAHRRELSNILTRTIKTMERMCPSEEEKFEFVRDLKSFVRYYEFLIQATSFKDIELHKKYKYIVFLLSKVNISKTGAGFNLKDKIEAEGFIQEKTGEFINKPLKSRPVVQLPLAKKYGFPEKKVEKLSDIIADINSRTGSSIDPNVAIKNVLSIKDSLVQDETLMRTAVSNDKSDFRFAYNDSIDDHLVKDIKQNEDFYNILLQNKEVKKQIFDVIFDEVYAELHQFKDRVAADDDYSNADIIVENSAEYKTRDRKH